VTTKRTKPRPRRAAPPAPVAVVIELSPEQLRQLSATGARLKRNRRGVPGWVTLHRRGSGFAMEFVFGLARS
jgi:hypothetical protein